MYVWLGQGVILEAVPSVAHLLQIHHLDAFALDCRDLRQKPTSGLVSRVNHVPDLETRAPFFLLFGKHGGLGFWLFGP